MNRLTFHYLNDLLDSLKDKELESSSKVSLLQSEIMQLQNSIKQIEKNFKSEYDAKTLELNGKWDEEARKFREEIFSLESDLESKEAVMLDMKKKHDDQVTMLKKDLDAASGSKQKFHILLDEKNGEIDALNQKIIVLTRELESKKIAASKGDEALIEKLKGDISQQDESITKLQLSCTTYKNLVSDLENQLTGLKSENEAISAHQIECMTNLEAESQAKESLKALNKEKDVALQKSSSRISELEKLTNSLKSEIENSRREISELKSAIANHVNNAAQVSILISSHGPMLMPI